MYLVKRCLIILCIWIAGKKMAGQNIYASVDQDLREHYEASNLPGFAVALIQDGEVVYRASYGFADIEKQILFTDTTTLNVGSASKTVVGVAMAQCLARGYFTLDAEINEFLPFEISYPKSPESIRIHHLGTHTSGLLDSKYYGNTYVPAKFTGSDYHPGFKSFLEKHKEISLSSFLKNLFNLEGKWYNRKNFSKGGPGAAFQYANVNAAFGALIVEAASGLSFRDYTVESIFQPLQMTRTSWVQPKEMATRYFPSGYKVAPYRLITYPDGGLYSSLEDLSRFVIEILKGRSGEPTVLDPIDIKALLPGDDDENRIFWGMGTESRDIGHTGSDPGVQVDLRFNADHETGIIVMTNVNAEDDSKLEKQFRGIIEILKKHFYLTN